MNRMLVPTLIVCSLFAAGCKGDPPPTSPAGGGGGGGGASSMKATIDGVNWVASAGGVQVSGSATATEQGTLSITGLDISSGVAISLSLSYISTPATYPLGVNIGSNAGGIGTVTTAPDSWTTPLNGAAGTVTITARTATRIAGTFQLTAAPLLGVGPDVVVTAGEFDVTVSAGLPPLPTGNASLMTAVMDGVAWNAATIVGIAGGASFGGSTTGYSLNLVAKVPIAAGGVYDIGSQFGATIMRTGTTDAWGVTVQDSVGYVTFVTVNAERISGFFAGTIPPVGTTATPLLVESGFFTVHLP